MSDMMGLLDRARSGEDVLSSVIILPLEKCAHLQLEVLNGRLQERAEMSRKVDSFNPSVPGSLKFALIGL